MYNGLFRRENPLLGIAGPRTWFANPHPCWSLAQSQLPHSRTCMLITHPYSPFSRKDSITIYTEDINMPESSSVRHINNIFAFASFSVFKYMSHHLCQIICLSFSKCVFVNFFVSYRHVSICIFIFLSNFLFISLCSCWFL